LAIYGTDEATAWGWREYHPETSGKRHRVAVTTTGYFGTLVDGDGLTLLTEGEVFCVEDELHGTTLDVGITEPQKVGTHREAVPQTSALLAASKR